ncbi:unknown [Ruminococcus sp. CAG:379]|nr:unknown [Ruminococcus sp. CAG:379]
MYPCASGGSRQVPCRLPCPAADTVCVHPVPQILPPGQSHTEAVGRTPNMSGSYHDHPAALPLFHRRNTYENHDHSGQSERLAHQARQIHAAAGTGKISPVRGYPGGGAGAGPASDLRQLHPGDPVSMPGDCQADCFRPGSRPAAGAAFCGRDLCGSPVRGAACLLEHPAQPYLPAGKHCYPGGGTGCAPVYLFPAAFRTLCEGGGIPLRPGTAVL